MPERRFMQVDVFTEVPTRGNGLAVVLDGAGLGEEEMQAFAAWTNLAETTFLMPPTAPETTAHQAWACTSAMPVMT